MIYSLESNLIYQHINVLQDRYLYLRLHLEIKNFRIHGYGGHPSRFAAPRLQEMPERLRCEVFFVPSFVYIYLNYMWCLIYKKKLLQLSF